MLLTHSRNITLLEAIRALSRPLDHWPILLRATATDNTFILDDTMLALAPFLQYLTWFKKALPRRHIIACWQIANGCTSASRSQNDFTTKILSTTLDIGDDKIDTFTPPSSSVYSQWRTICNAVKQLKTRKIVSLP